MAFKSLLAAVAAALCLAGTGAAQERATVSLSSFTLEGTTVTIASSSWRSVPNAAFHAGEDMFYVIRWGVITGGYSTLSVHGLDEVEGRRAYHLVEQAHSAGWVDAFYTVHDRNDAWLDAQSLATLRYEKRIREGHYQVQETVTVNQLQHRLRDHSYRVDKKTYEDKELPVPPNVLDVLGSLYYVRTSSLTVGDSYTLDVYSSGKVWPLVVKVIRREKVSVPAGKFDCFRVEPLLREQGIFITKGRKLEVWLTADERHMPVLMRSEVFIGHVAALLVSYHTLVEGPPPAAVATPKPELGPSGPAR
jgi:hypothetical protein